MTIKKMALALTKIIELGEIKKITFFDVKKGVLWTIREYDNEAGAVLEMEKSERADFTEIINKKQHSLTGLYQYKTIVSGYIPLHDELPPIKTIFEKMLQALEN